MCQLNNLELAVNLARRGNLPGAEGLVCLYCLADIGSGVGCLYLILLEIRQT